jgi:hypothetical protein
VKKLGQTKDRTLAAKIPVTATKAIFRRHDMQHKGTHHIDIQHDNKKIATLSIMALLLR